jgi:hypothetical protein
MLPAFTQLLPRVSRRCFASRAVLFNASSSTPSAKPVYPRPTVGKGAYSGISIEDPQSAPQQPAQGTTWNDHPVGGMATQPPTDPTEKWRAHSRAIVPTLQKLQIADAYSGLVHIDPAEPLLAVSQGDTSKYGRASSPKPSETLRKSWLAIECDSPTVQLRGTRKRVRSAGGYAVNSGANILLIKCVHGSYCLVKFSLTRGYRFGKMCS